MAQNEVHQQYLNLSGLFECFFLILALADYAGMDRQLPSLITLADYDIGIWSHNSWFIP